MKGKQFSEEQIIGILKEADAGGGESVPAAWDVERDLYAWKAKFGGLEASDAERLRALEEENATRGRACLDWRSNVVGSLSTTANPAASGRH